MRISLGLRLFAVAALAIAAALAAVSLATRIAVRTEFRRYEHAEHLARLEGVAKVLALRLESAGDPSRLDPLLEEVGRSAEMDKGFGLLLMGPDGEVLGASTPELRAARVTTRPGDRIELEIDQSGGGMVRRSAAVIQGGPRAPVKRRDGSVIGTLVPIPIERGSGPLPPRAAFGSRFDSGLLLAAAAAGLVALVLTWALSRRILEPVGALTRAARRLGRGDLSQRVAVKSSDEIGELSRAFNAMAEDLARQESLRRTLVTDVAHELRTPLTNLRCQIEAVEDGLLPASPETVRSLREEVLLLSRLVEDLQTLSVAEAGRLALDRAAVAVRDLAEGALDGFRAAAAERGVRLVNAVPDLPPVLADATRVGQVLRNLLTNAASHLAAGGTITVSAALDEAAGAPAAGGDATRVTIEVCDDGPGIAREHLPHLFERFYRADPARARATGGAGLGLAIVKGIVEAHGGTVGVESAPGSGARFRFTLPLA